MPYPSSPLPVAPLPTGTLTFLFTDIEGSTQLWEQHPQAMPAALARHDAILRQAMEFTRSSPTPPLRWPLRWAHSAYYTPNHGAKRVRCGCAWRCTRVRPNYATVTTSAHHSTAWRASSRPAMAGR